MTGPRLNLVLLADQLAVCRLDRDAAIPGWATQGSLFSITRTGDERSVVCPEGQIPEGARAETGWRALRVAGVLDFAQVGILAALASTLACAGISLCAVSTFDTDDLLVKEYDLGRAFGVLGGAGYSVDDAPGVRAT